MPTLWRYLLTDYFKVLILSASGFIAILLTSRLEEIAHFAAFGPTFKLVLLYTLYQIPYILPIAIPVSCLISSILLMSRLSTTHELTALRSAGFSLKTIITPLLFAAAWITLLNFYVVSELATDAHLKSNLLKNELRSINPLLILNNKHLTRMRGIYFDTLGPSKNRQKASELILAMPNKENGGINLLLTRKLNVSKKNFIAEGVTLLSPLSKREHGFGELLVENIGKLESSIEDFSHFTQKNKIGTLSNDRLNLGLLLIRLKEQIRAKNSSSWARQNLYLTYAEIIRRLSATLAPFTFTLLGLSYGIRLGRGKNAKKVFVPILLASLYLTCFFAAKAVEKTFILSSLLYLLPHFFILIFSIFAIKRVTRGIA